MSATPLTKPRAASERTVKRDKRPLQASVHCYKGGLAACDAQGYFKPAAGVLGEIVVGRFYEEVDNSAGIAGALLATVEHFYERDLFLVDNDTGAPVTIAQRERVVGVLDDHTATLLAAGIGPLAICYDVTSEGVWVDITQAGNVVAANGLSAVQSGTATLVAGTKTITGVKLTANSLILLTMRDPGSGAITAFAAFDAPVASRNTSTGQFVINAIDNTKAVITTAVSTVDWLIVG